MVPPCSTSWPEQHGNARSSRYQLAEKFQALCSGLFAFKKLTPVKLPSGRPMLATRPRRTGVVGNDGWMRFKPIW